MADALSLLFTLTADGQQAVAEFQRVRKAFAVELEGIRKLADKAVRLNVQSATGRRAAGQAGAATTTTATAIQQQRLTNQQQRLNNLQQQGTIITQRYTLAQGRLGVQQQQLTNAQGRAQLGARRLALAQQRLTQLIINATSAQTTLNRSFAAFGNSLRSLGQGFASLGATLTISVSAPLAAIGAGVIDAAVRMDSLRRGLTTIAGGAEEAATQLARLTELAKLPGIGFEEAIQGSIRLQAVGFAANDAERALRQFSNAIALTGGGRENLENVTVQLGQMAAQSKVLAQDLKPIISSAPAVAVALREAFGTVRSEEIQELGISSKEFIDTLVKELERLPRATAGARNSFDNFRDSVFQAAAVVGESFLPILIRLAEAAGPIITTLANVFRALPVPLQAVVVVFGALAVALGPLTFLFGQLITGLGRVTVGFAQLNALGLLPTIANVRLLGQVMAGTASLVQGAGATAAASAVGWAALGATILGVIGVIAAVAAVIVAYSSAQEEAISIDVKAAQARQARISQLQFEVNELEGLAKQQQLSAEAQDRIKKTYEALDSASRNRIEFITDERRQLEELIRVKKEQLRIDQFAQQSVTFQATEDALKRVREVVDATREQAKAQREFAQAAKTAADQLERVRGGGVVSREEQRRRIALAQQIAENAALGEGAKTTEELNKAQIEAGRSLTILAEVTGRAGETTEQATERILEQLRAHGANEEAIESARKAIDAFARSQDEAADDVDQLTSALRRQLQEFKRRGDAAERETKQTKEGIEGLVAEIAREAISLDDAKKALAGYLKLYPELRGEIEKLKRAGNLEQILLESLGLRKASREADQQSRRRLRLLEIEADRARTIAEAQLARDQIAFDERKKSLKDFTDAQIVAAHDVFTAQQHVFTKEREEAAKIRDQSLRDLTFAEIRQKELESLEAFNGKVRQVEADQRKEEFDATRAHRKAILELNEQADEAELARLRDLQEQGFTTAFDVANRQAELERAARARRRAELETQLKEAGENKEERGRIEDELKQFNEESAESVKKNERIKRDAIQETADAYRDYVLTIREALENTADAARDAAAISLTRLSARAFLTQKQRIRLQFIIDNSLLNAEKRASDLRIDNAEHEAIEKAKKAGKLGEDLLKIEKTFDDQRLEEQKLFEQKRKKLIEDAKADLERAGPNTTRSLFGDTFADFAEALRAAAAKAEVAISNLQVMLGGFAAAAAEHFASASASAGNFISILLDGIDQINQGLADMLENWILTGETGSAALRKLLASTLAYYAKTFLIKALDNIGEGFSNLAKASAAAAAGNFVSAALYHDAAIKNFASAAKYGIASAATAIAGRLVAGDTFKQKETASRATTGGEVQPNNRTFNFGGQTPVESSSRAAQEGSGGVLGAMVARIEDLQKQNVELQRQQQLQTAQITQALTKLNTARPGDVVTMGATDAREAIGVAVIDHSNSSGDFNERLQRNLGFAR